MKTVTTRVDTDTHAEIVERAEESDRSKSAVARELIEQGLEYDDLKDERDRLQRKLTETNARQDDVSDRGIEFYEEHVNAPLRTDDAAKAVAFALSITADGTHAEGRRRALSYVIDADTGEA